MKKNIFIILIIAAVVIGLVAVLTLKTSLFSKSAEPPEKTQTVPSFDVLFKGAVRLQEQGELLKAQEAFKMIVAYYANLPQIEEIQKRLEDLNTKIIFSAISVPEETTIYTVEPGDSLTKIAKRFNTTIEFIRRQNGLSSNVIRPQMRLRIWTGKFSILVDKSQNFLALKSNGEIIKTYRVSTGKDNITPVGTFKIISKLIDPAWTHEGKVIPSGSPENILGTRWLGFDVPGYGLHGTTQPDTIGQQVTAGCVRMLNSDAEELYDLLPLDTEVTILD